MLQSMFPTWKASLNIYVPSYENKSSMKLFYELELKNVFFADQNLEALDFTLW